MTCVMTWVASGEPTVFLESDCNEEFLFVMYMGESTKDPAVE